MTWTPFVTSVFIGILFTLLVVMDVTLAVLVGNDATLSKAMQRIGKAWPIVVVFWGGLAAHFFLPQERHWCGCWMELKPYILLAVGLLAFRLAWAQSP